MRIYIATTQFINIYQIDFLLEEISSKILIFIGHPQVHYAYNSWFYFTLHFYPFINPNVKYLSNILMQSKVAMFDFAYEISKRKFIYTHQVSCFIYINVKEFLKQFGTKRCQSSDDKDFHSSSKNNENKSRIFCLQLHNNKVHFFFYISTKYLQKSEVKKRFFSYQKPEGSGEMFYAFAKIFFFLVYFL